MARKIMRVSEETVIEVHGERRVHRAGSRRCMFCDTHHATGNTESSNSRIDVVNIGITSSVIDIHSNSSNIMRSDTAVTMITVSVSQDTGVNNIGMEDENLRPSVYRIHAITLNPVDQNNAEASSRSPGILTGDGEQLYNVLMTIRCSANTTLP